MARCNPEGEVTRYQAALVMNIWRTAHLQANVRHLLARARIRPVMMANRFRRDIIACLSSSPGLKVMSWRAICIVPARNNISHHQ